MGEIGASGVKEHGQTGLLNFIERYQNAGKPSNGKEFFGDMIIPSQRPGDEADEVLVLFGEIRTIQKLEALS